MGQQAPRRGVALGRDEVAPVLDEHPEPCARHRGRSARVCEVADETDRRHREQPDSERALMDALPEEIHAWPQPMPLEMKQPAQTHPTH